MVASLFQTSPPTENYYEIWTVYVYVCICVYKHLFEGIIELARQQGLDGPRSHREGKPRDVSLMSDSAFPLDPLADTKDAVGAAGKLCRLTGLVG